MELSWWVAFAFLKQAQEGAGADVEMGGVFCGADFDQRGLRGVTKEQMSIARADREAASSVSRDIARGEFVFDAAVGAIHDPKLIAGRQSQKEVIGVGSISEAEENVFGIQM